jgi:hypothetical protein
MGASFRFLGSIDGRDGVSVDVRSEISDLRLIEGFAILARPIAASY